VERFDQRQGFLVSALVHLVVLMTLASHPRLLEQPAARPSPLPETGPKVFLPPQAELRRLFPKALAPRSAPTPAPAPPPKPSQKDRISVGAPTDLQTRKPLVLRRDESLLGVAKGRPDAVPAPAPPAPTPAPTPTPASAPVSRRDTATADAPGTAGLRLPPGMGEAPTPRGQEGAKRGAAGPEPPSIMASLRDLDRRLQDSGPRGVPTGTTQRLGALSFDPEGADFTAWVDHFRIEAYNNWIIPKPAELGYRGHVTFEFVVERDGTVSSIRMLEASGVPAFDRAARNAVMGSRLLPLPADFGPARVTMTVIFSYNEGPSGS
jgi:protein TonB